MRISLRKARAGDELELARLASAVLPEAWSAQGFAASLETESARALVAEEQGALVGFALARRAADEAELLSLCVEPVHQGRGLGRRLAETLFAQLRAEGVLRVHLEVRGSNAAARALYGALGFRESRRRAGYYRDGEDALELGVAL
jgi:[ribosomal protein S18]-alanine N-acetyltransferase